MDELTREALSGGDLVAVAGTRVSLAQQEWLDREASTQGVADRFRLLRAAVSLAAVLGVRKHG